MAAAAGMRAAQRKKEQVRQEAEANKREREKARAHDHHGTSGSLDAEGFVNELMEDTTKLDLNEGESAGARRARRRRCFFSRARARPPPFCARAQATATRCPTCSR